MRPSRTNFFLLSVFLAFTAPALAQVNDTYVIPAVIWSGGDAGTQWSTSVDVFNPQQYALTVAIIFLPSHGAPGLEVLLDLEPNENVHTDNVLRDWFGRGGTGALLFATFPEDNPGIPDDIVSLSFLVNSRTYTTAPTGTYGYSMPGTWAYGLMDYEFDGLSAIVHGVNDWGVPGFNGFRTNIGAANLGRSSVAILVVVYDARGRLIADDLVFHLPPMSHEQQRLPVGVRNGTIEFFLDDVSQEAVVFPYAAVVDNRSGDPVHLEPLLLANPDILFKKNQIAGELGKKLDLAIARDVRSTASRIGVVASDGEGARFLKTAE